MPFSPSFVILLELLNFQESTVWMVDEGGPQTQPRLSCQRLNLDFQGWQRRKLVMLKNGIQNPRL